MFSQSQCPISEYADIATTENCDNKIKTLKYGGFPDIFPALSLLRYS